MIQRCLFAKKLNFLFFENFLLRLFKKGKKKGLTFNFSLSNKKRLATSEFETTLFFFEVTHSQNLDAKISRKIRQKISFTIVILALPVLKKLLENTAINLSKVSFLKVCYIYQPMSPCKIRNNSTDLTE